VHYGSVGSINFVWSSDDLCDMMRMHLGNLARYGGVNVAKFEDGGKNNKVSELCRREHQWHIKL
jgi:hypothetical protein